MQNPPPDDIDRQIAEHNALSRRALDLSPSYWLAASEKYHDTGEHFWLCTRFLDWEQLEANPDARLAIEARIRFGESYVLLAGKALEQVLIAARVCADNSLVVNGDLAYSIRDARLVQLSDGLTGFEFSGDEDNLLAKCESVLPHHRTQDTEPLLEDYFADESRADDFRITYNTLYRRLCLSVYSQLKAGWQSLHKTTMTVAYNARYEDRQG